MASTGMKGVGKGQQGDFDYLNKSGMKKGIEEDAASQASTRVPSTKSGWSSSTSTEPEPTPGCDARVGTRQVGGKGKAARDDDDDESGMLGVSDDEGKVTSKHSDYSSITSSSRASAAAGPARKASKLEKSRQKMMRRALEQGREFRPWTDPTTHRTSTIVVLVNGVRVFNAKASELMKEIIESQPQGAVFERLFATPHPSIAEAPETDDMRRMDLMLKQVGEQTGKCPMCNKEWGWGHREGSQHQKLLREAASLNDLLGFRAVRPLWSVMAKPFYGPLYKTTFAAHWAGNDAGVPMNPHDFEKFFVEKAKQVILERGVLIRVSNSKPMQKFFPKVLHDAQMYVVPYSGTGVYNPNENRLEFMARKFSELPWDEHIEKPCMDALFMENTMSLGWWPVIAITLEDVEIQVIAEAEFDGQVIVITVIILICVYQLGYANPEGWRCVAVMLRF